jgi:Bifunctional DNA primase/polymerase, N-terminal
LTADNDYEILQKFTVIGGFIIPCCWPVNGKCGCGRNHEGRDIGKVPLLEHGYQDKRRTQNLLGIREFVQKYGTPNWGCHFPGHIILDVDKGKGGFEALTKLQQDIGLLPKTLTNLTGGGGLHILYKLPVSHLSLSASTLPGYPGIDVRIKAYIILPPSLHVSGNRYRIHHDLPVVEAPESLLNLFNKPQDLPQPDCQPGALITSNQDNWLISYAGYYRYRGDTEDQIRRKLKIDLERCPTLDANDPWTEADMTRLTKSAGRYPVDQKEDDHFWKTSGKL